MQFFKKKNIQLQRQTFKFDLTDVSNVQMCFYSLGVTC